MRKNNRTLKLSAMCLVVIVEDVDLRVYSRVSALRELHCDVRSRSPRCFRFNARHLLQSKLNLLLQNPHCLIDISDSDSLLSSSVAFGALSTPSVRNTESSSPFVV